MGTRVLYWFRRDLRLHDNRALLEACRAADEVAPVYVLDEAVLEERGLRHNGRWLALLFNLLRELSSRAKLRVFVGRTRDVLDELLSRGRFDAVFTAAPLSWTEERLAGQVRELCAEHGVAYREVLDGVLADPRRLEPGRTFSSFYERWAGSVDAEVLPEVPTGKFVEVDGPSPEELARRVGVSGGGDPALDPSWGRLRLSSFDFGRYDGLRDYPYADGTSRLSHFVSLGVVSARELFNAARGRSREFVRQLAWREYYYALGARYPWMERLELKPYMRGFEWENDRYLIEAFEEGRTGYPIVDAGIRQLKAEGWVHNRVRLVLASFLVKDLHVDWRVGEEFFRRHLVDYDEVLNVGNWQWAASAGVDPLPLRIFNPVLQSRRYDPMCLYIKKYVPELEGHDCEELHDPLRRRIRGYYEPVVDHHERVERFRKLVARRLRGSAG